MDVVIRGIMASALGMYAVIHASQFASGPESSPGWLSAAFAATAVAAFVLAIGLIAGPERLQSRIDDAAAALVGGSLVALVLSLTVGFFGVSESQVRVETAVVLVAEVVVLVTWGLAKRFGGQQGLQEVNERGLTASPR